MKNMNSTIRSWWNSKESKEYGKYHFCEITIFLSLIKGLNDNIHKGIKGETVCFSDLGEAYSGLSGKGGDDFGYGEPFITYMNVHLKLRKKLV